MTMYPESEGAAEGVTAFRVAEKLYQRHVEAIPKLKKGKLCGTRLMERPTDLSGVLDVDAPLPPGGPAVEHADRVYTFPVHPGMVLFRAALGPAAQRDLVQRSLFNFPSPPAHTNFNRSLGRPLPPGLWGAAQEGLCLGPADSQLPWVPKSDPAAGPPAARILQKLRWASVGPVYDWTRRVYAADWEHAPLPPDLAELAARLAEAAAAATPTAASPAAPFRPDAAIVNYYREGDTLGGHIDDAEPDMTQPLVSLSVGRPAIFLMGGPTREAPPTAILLRSGDSVVLAGPARRCFHGLCRIFPLRGGGRRGKVRRPEGALRYEEEGVEWGEGGPGFEAMAEHMAGCRINVSVRSTASLGELQGGACSGP